MISDLQQLNRTIATHSLGTLTEEQALYLGQARICVGQLVHTVAALRSMLSSLRRTAHGNILRLELNRRYIQFARLASMEAAADRPEALLALGISWEHAGFFRELSDEDIECLAFGLGVPIVRLMKRELQGGSVLHESAGRQHASAFVAARPPLRLA